MRVVQLFGRERDEARAVRRAQPRTSRRAPAIDHDLRALLPGDRVPHVGRAGDPDRRGRAPRRRSARSPWASVAAFLQLAAPLLPAAAGSVRQVQHAAAGDGGVGADLPAARHGAGRRAAPRRSLRDARSRAPRVDARDGVTIAFEDVWFHYGARRGRRDAGVGAARGELRGAAGRDAGARRAHRGGEDDDRQPAAALLRSAARPHHSSNGVDVRDLPLDELRGG